MTDREKAIVMAYTGYTMLAGDKLDVFYRYVQEKLGRSVMTHELADDEVSDAIQEAARKDFVALAKADGAELPEIIRCKDCQHSCDYTDIYSDHAYKCTKNGGYHNDDWFCADWERKVKQND